MQLELFDTSCELGYESISLVWYELDGHLGLDRPYCRLWAQLGKQNLTSTKLLEGDSCSEGKEIVNGLDQAESSYRKIVE